MKLYVKKKCKKIQKRKNNLQKNYENCFSLKSSLFTGIFFFALDLDVGANCLYLFIFSKFSYYGQLKMYTSRWALHNERFYFHMFIYFSNLIMVFENASVCHVVWQSKPNPKKSSKFFPLWKETIFVVDIATMLLSFWSMCDCNIMVSCNII